MISWVFFISSAIVAYIGIAIFAHMSGSSATAMSAFFSALRPVPLVIVTVANMFFGLGLYYGLGLTRFAIPLTIAVGVITSAHIPTRHKTSDIDGAGERRMR
jgi:hypothetical protein